MNKTDSFSLSLYVLTFIKVKDLQEIGWGYDEEVSQIVARVVKKVQVPRVFVHWDQISDFGPSLIIELNEIRGWDLLGVR